MQTGWVSVEGWKKLHFVVDRAKGWDILPDHLTACNLSFMEKDENLEKSKCRNCENYLQKQGIIK